MYNSVLLTPDGVMREKDVLFSETLYVVDKAGVMEICRDERFVWLFNSRNNIASRLLKSVFAKLFENEAVRCEELLSLFRGDSYLVNSFINDGLIYKKEIGPYKDDSEYVPTIFIVPSMKCNLRCVYCYSDAGLKKDDISEKYYKVAIDDFINQVVDCIGYLCKGLLGETQYVRMVLMGGGEPTLNQRLFFDIVNYFYDVCSRYNIAPKIALTSNATFSPEISDFLCENKCDVMISIDGKKAIQNKQRPFADGGASYDAVEKNLSLLVQGGCNVVMRSTIMKESCRYMGDILEIALKSNVKKIQIEPLSAAGRAREDYDLCPNAEFFKEELVKLFIRAYAVGVFVHSYNLPIVQKRKKTFCGASGSNRIITTDGHVSTCTEVSEVSDPYADLFIVGRVDVEKRSIVVDQDKIEKLKRRSVENMMSCKKCFLRYNCAGNCYTRALRVTGDMYNPDQNWCDVSVSASKEIVIRMLS